MKLNPKTLEPHFLEIEIEDEDYGLAVALRDLLIQDKDVEFAAIRQEHPQVGKPTVVLRTKTKKALALLEAAVETVQEQAVEFRGALKNAGGSAAPAKKSKSK